MTIHGAGTNMSGDEPVLVLRSSRKSWFLVLAIGLGFVVIGVWMLNDPRVHAWFAWFEIAFFGLVTIVALISLLPGSSYLRLTPAGFTMCSLYRAHYYSWDQVEQFGAMSVTVHKMVGFNLTKATPQKTLAPSASRELSGWDAALPATYGLGVEELAALLNEWHRRYAPKK